MLVNSFMEAKKFMIISTMYSIVFTLIYSLRYLRKNTNR